LVGAIPAAFLLYLLVMVLLSHSDKLPTMLMAIVVVTLLCAGAVAVMPFGILVLGGKKADKDADAEPVSSKSKKGKDQDSDELAVADEVEADIEEAVEEEGSSDFDIGESDADIMSDSDDEISGPASSLDEIEASDFDEEEDEPPAKKKKKK
jgi:hypothetical protein